MNRIRIGMANSIQPAMRNGTVENSPCMSWLKRNTPRASTGSDGIYSNGVW